MKEEQNRAEEQARAQFESIKEMVQKLNNEETEEEGIEEIQNDPLSVEIRSGWESYAGDLKAVEFKILLCTGGPAVRIIGDLDDHQQPETAKIEYQDWFTSWYELDLNSEEEEILLQYCNQFYFGE